MKIELPFITVVVRREEPVDKFLDSEYGQLLTPENSAKLRQLVGEDKVPLENLMYTAEKRLTGRMGDLELVLPDPATLPAFEERELRRDVGRMLAAELNSYLTEQNE